LKYSILKPSIAHLIITNIDANAIPNEKADLQNPGVEITF
jgi:hypothetical protein